jgi:hypothetical protein
MRLYSASVSPTTLAGAVSMRLLIRGYRYLRGHGRRGDADSGVKSSQARKGSQEKHGCAAGQVR